MLLIFFVVRNVTIYIREIYMIVFERISCVYLVSAGGSSWKCSRQVLRSFPSGVYRVSLKEGVNARFRSAL